MKKSLGHSHQRVLILAGSIAALLAVQPAMARTFTFDGGTSGTGAALDTAANWLVDGQPTDTDEVLLDSSNITLPPTMSTSTALSYGDLIVNPTGGANLAISLNTAGSTSSTLTLSGNTYGDAAVTAGGAYDDLLLLGSNVTAGTVTIGGNSGGGTGALNVVLGVAGKIDVVNSGATLNIASKISGGYALTKTGSGTLVLGGTNTYTGTTTVNGGVLSISSNANLGAVATGLVLNSGTLKATSTFNLDNAGANKRAISVTNAAIDVTSGNNLTVTGVISGSDLTKNGTGILTLSNANTFTGGFRDQWRNRCDVRK